MCVFFRGLRFSFSSLSSIFFRHLFCCLLRKAAEASAIFSVKTFPLFTLLISRISLIFSSSASIFSTLKSIPYLCLKCPSRFLKFSSSIHSSISRCSENMYPTKLSTFNLKLSFLSLKFTSFFHLNNGPFPIIILSKSLL